MASHKGYGLGMMVEILAATLSGASFSAIRSRTQKQGDPDNCGHFLMAIDPKSFRPEGDFEDALDDMIDVFHSTRPIDPSRPVLVAGEIEEETREFRRREGVPVTAMLSMQIRGVCARAGVPFLLEERRS